MLNIVKSSGGAVTFKLAAEISAKISSEVMSRVYEQVNPDALGQDFRDLSVATKYCELLHKRSRNLRPGAIKRLVHDYPSHDFVIDAEEAKEIFERLEPPSAALYHLMAQRAADIFIPKSARMARLTGRLSIMKKQALKGSRERPMMQIVQGKPQVETPMERRQRRDALLTYE